MPRNEGTVTRQAAIAFLAALAPIAVATATTQTPAPIAPADANPDRAAIAAGRQTYMVNCSACHGTDGRAQVQAMANAADLTHPEWFKRGSGDAEIIAAIQNGLGNGMPAHKDILSEAETRDVVKYIRSIQAPAKAH